MLKEVVTPIHSSDFDSRAQYNRAWSEKKAILNFIINIMVACWSMKKESDTVEAKKKSLLDRIKPKSNRQGLKFVEFLNKKTMHYAKTHGGTCCPRCGYWMFPIEKDSNATMTSLHGLTPSTMVENYCSMCGELIERVNRTSAELDYINADIRKWADSAREEEMNAENRKYDAIAERVAAKMNGGI
jgi:hypothetical protein